MWGATNSSQQLAVLHHEDDILSLHSAFEHDLVRMACICLMPVIHKASQRLVFVPFRPMYESSWSGLLHMKFTKGDATNSIFARTSFRRAATLSINEQRVSTNILSHILQWNHLTHWNPMTYGPMGWDLTTWLYPLNPIDNSLTPYILMQSRRWSSSLVSRPQWQPTSRPGPVMARAWRVQWQPLPVGKDGKGYAAMPMDAVCRNHWNFVRNPGKMCLGRKGWPPNRNRSRSGRFEHTVAAVRWRHTANGDDWIMLDYVGVRCGFIMIHPPDTSIVWAFEICWDGSWSLKLGVHVPFPPAAAPVAGGLFWRCSDVGKQFETQQPLARWFPFKRCHVVTWACKGQPPGTEHCLAPRSGITSISKL